MYNRIIKNDVDFLVQRDYKNISYKWLTVMSEMWRQYLFCFKFAFVILSNLRLNIINILLSVILLLFIMKIISCILIYQLLWKMKSVNNFFFYLTNVWVHVWGERYFLGGNPNPKPCPTSHVFPLYLVNNCLVKPFTTDARVMFSTRVITSHLRSIPLRLYLFQQIERIFISFET